MDEQDDLFAIARRQREMEIARYKADPSLPAPVMLSARNNPDVKIKWETKHTPDPKEPTP